MAAVSPKRSFVKTEKDRGTTFCELQNNSKNIKDPKL